MTVAMTTAMPVTFYANVTNMSTTAKSSAASSTTYVSGAPLIIFSVIIGLLAVLGSVGNVVSMYVYYPRGKQGNTYVFFLSCIEKNITSWPAFFSSSAKPKK